MNITSTNFSVQQTCCQHDIGNFSGADDISRLTLTPAMSVVMSMHLLISVTSGFLNSLLLWSLVRVDRRTLTAKPFLLSLALANASMPVAHWLQLLNLLDIFGSLQINVRRCWHSIASFTSTILLLVQALSAVGLSCDRLYAVVRPLHYNLLRYNNNAVRIALIVCPWMMAVCVEVGFLGDFWISESAKEGGISVLCIPLLDAVFYIQDLTFLDIFFMVTKITSFLVYMAVFAVVKYQRCAIKALSAKSAAAQSSSMSLTITFFLANVTSLALYLPAPFYSMSVGGAFTMAASRDVLTTGHGLLILYMCNTCLDPLILASRIPSIRNNLPIKRIPRSSSARVNYNAGGNKA